MTKRERIRLTAQEFSRAVSVASRERPVQKAVWWELKEWEKVLKEAGEYDHPWPTAFRLAEDTGLPLQSVRQALRSLRKNGFAEGAGHEPRPSIYRGGRGRARYRITRPVVRKSALTRTAARAEAHAPA